MLGFVVGCENADIEERIGLSDPVAAAVPTAVSTVHELLEEELGLPPPAPVDLVASPSSARSAPSQPED